MNIKHFMSEDIAKKIFGNKDNAEKFLLELSNIKPITLKTKEIKRGKNKGKTQLDYTTSELWKKIVEEWDYDSAIKIIRKLFMSTPKYKNGKEADNAMKILIEEWNNLNLGKIEWPFSQGAFDDFVQRINSENCSGLEKDNKVKKAAVKYRRIKEINTVRNDFIETLIFEKNENILPTLNHRRGVDFFINGESFDQKVAKSPTIQFKRKYKDKWREVAIEHPEIVAEYLYTYQDEGRFGADSRLLIVFLDEDVSVERIKEIIENTDLENPIEVTFSYKHKSIGTKTYKVKCFIILLHN